MNNGNCAVRDARSRNLTLKVITLAHSWRAHLLSLFSAVATFSRVQPLRTSGRISSTADTEDLSPAAVVLSHFVILSAISRDCCYRTGHLLFKMTLCFPPFSYLKRVGLIPLEFIFITFFKFAALFVTHPPSPAFAALITILWNV